MHTYSLLGMKLQASNSTSPRVAIAGATGYAGQELLRLLEREPLLEQRLPLLVEASFAAVVIDVDLGMSRGAVVVDVGVEEAGIELVDGRGMGRVFSKWRKP